MLKFDNKGYLTPNNNIPSTLEEFKSEFVDLMPGERRSELFDGYQRYCNDLKTVLDNESFFQWIDGSYVTKKQEPNDLDVVTFINGAVVDLLKEKLEPFKFPKSVENYGVDGYIVAVFDEAHKHYPVYLADKGYWMDHFDKTRRGRNGQKHQKGFLELIY